MNYNCVDDVENKNNTSLVSISELIGGGRDGECQMSCVNRLEFGYICYSDVGFTYDVWYLIMWLGYLIAFCYTIYSTFLLTKVQQFTLNVQYTTILLNLFTIMTRIIWLICIYDGRMPDVILGGVITETILIKVGQTIMLSEFFGIIQVWKTLIESSTKMRKIDKKAQRRNKMMNAFFALFLIAIVGPLSILGIWIIELNTIVNIVLLLFILGLVFGGVKYMIMIRELLGHSSNNETQNGVLKTIIHVVQIFCLCGVIALLTVVANTLKLTYEPFIRVWAWWFPVHICEVFVLTILPYSISTKARQERNKKNQSNEIITKTAMISSKVINSSISLQ